MVHGIDCTSLKWNHLMEKDRYTDKVCSELSFFVWACCSLRQSADPTKAQPDVGCRVSWAQVQQHFCPEHLLLRNMFSMDFRASWTWCLLEDTIGMPEVCHRIPENFKTLCHRIPDCYGLLWTVLVLLVLLSNRLASASVWPGSGGSSTRRLGVRLKNKIPLNSEDIHRYTKFD